jgi:TolA-binding protein
MHIVRFTLTALLAGFALVACKPADDEAAQKAVQDAVEKVRESTESMGAAVDGMQEQMTREANVSKAREDLTRLRDQIANNETVEDASKRVEQARKDLAAAYGKAEGEAADWWKDTEPHLNNLAEDAQAGAETLGQRIDEVLKDLERRPK